MKTIRTHNIWHIGDHLVHLNFLRRVALENLDCKFIHYAGWHYLSELRDAVSDVPNIELAELNYMLPADSINAWRGDNQHWYDHPRRNEFVAYHLEWFDFLAKRMGVKNPVKKPADMLFDYPAILKPIGGAGNQPFDVLVINCRPGSGQFQRYSEFALAALADRMAARGHKVIATDPLPNSKVQSTRKSGLTITQIGHLSLHCHTLVMVSTGPSWPTFNIWNTETVKERILLLDTERVWLSPNTYHCDHMPEVEARLQQAGLL
jgi:hypothetical protein